MSDQAPTLLLVAQSGRLTYEAVLFLASLRHTSPDFTGKVVIAEPEPGPLWPTSPSINDPDARELIARFNAEVRTFHSHHFGAAYPQGNKIEALSVLDKKERFVFFDSDTLVLGNLAVLDFPVGQPTASMAREGTWPRPPLYGPGYAEIWRALYERFGVDFEKTLDHSHTEDNWERYLYFNAGWFTGDEAHTFRDRMLEIMLSVRDDTPPELAAQALFPWLDQIALPVAIASHGGGRPNERLNGLDGAITNHWRAMPLFYAKATNAEIAKLHEIVAPNYIKKVLKSHEPFKRMIYQGRGEKVRALFDRTNLPAREQSIRQKIKRAGLWMR